MHGFLLQFLIKPPSSRTGIKSIFLISLADAEKAFIQVNWKCLSYTEKALTS